MLKSISFFACKTWHISSVKVSRLFLKTVLNGCIDWARENKYDPQINILRLLMINVQRIKNVKKCEIKPISCSFKQIIGSFFVYFMKIFNKVCI